MPIRFVTQGQGRRAAPVAVTASLLAGVVVAGGVAVPASADEPTATPAGATYKVKVKPPHVFAAPKGRRGGITNPLAACVGTPARTATVVWTLTGTASGWSKTFRFPGDLPGEKFPRVDAGQYRSVTTATCGSDSLTRTHLLEVVRKTRAGTLSRAEFEQVRTGMTRQQVRAVTGLTGRDPVRTGGRRTWTYDMMRFWRWAQITFRNGRVVAKHWNVAHD